MNYSIARTLPCSPTVTAGLSQSSSTRAPHDECNLAPVKHHRGYQTAEDQSITHSCKSLEAFQHPPFPCYQVGLFWQGNLEFCNGSGAQKKTTVMPLPGYPLVVATLSDC